MMLLMMTNWSDFFEIDNLILRSIKTRDNVQHQLQQLNLGNHLTN